MEKMHIKFSTESTKYTFCNEKNVNIQNYGKALFGLNSKIDADTGRINLSWDKLKSNNNTGLNSTTSILILNLNGMNSKWKTKLVRMNRDKPSCLQEEHLKVKEMRNLKIKRTKHIPGT